MKNDAYNCRIRRVSINTLYGHMIEYSLSQRMSNDAVNIDELTFITSINMFKKY
jgi:hypothetical protein